MPGFWGATNPSCLSAVVSGNMGFFSDFKSAHFKKFDSRQDKAVIALAVGVVSPRTPITEGCAYIERRRRTLTRKSSIHA